MGMRIPAKLIAPVALAAMVAATSTAMGAPERKAGAAERAVAAPPPADGSVTLALKDATVAWDCPAQMLASWSHWCSVSHVISVTLTNGFAILTENNGARTIIPRERLINLVDVATVAEKP